MAWSRAGRLRAGGRTLAYVEAGPGDGPRPVVFVHGAGGDRESWLLLMRDLARRGLRSLALELPGHGGSPGPGCASIAGYARLVGDFLQASDLPPPLLAGHSMGGAVALACALEGAGRLAGLILVGTGARLRVREEILRGLRERFEETVGVICEFAYGGGAPPALVEEGRRRLLACPPEVLHGDMSACDRFDVMDALGRIALPALVLCGREDRLTPPKYAEHLASAIPGARLSLIEGAGHMVMLERTRAVGEAIAEFHRTLP